MNFIIYLLISVLLILVVLIVSMSLYYKKELNIYNTDMQRKLQDATQKMFEIMGQNISSEHRYISLNEALLIALDFEYSTLCLYDGNNYEVKATNIEEEYKEAICDIVKDNSFKYNILNNNSKYITVDKNETLLYKSAIERGIKSALFSPIYYDDKYIGFWLVESKHKNYFENVKDEEITSLKKNIAIFIEDTEFQNTLEIAKNVDKQTGFYNNIYLYSNARKMISLYENSAIILVGLSSLPDVNEEYTRNIGNLLLIKLANKTKEVLPKESILVRYSGIRFVIVVPNATAQAIQPIVEKLLAKYREIYEYVDDKKVNIDTQILVHTFKKQNNIEKETQKMNSYMDEMKSINTIKII